MAKENFRKFTTSSGIEALGGKSADNNEQIIKQADNNEYILHTAKPGSPFVNLKADEEDVSEKDLQEAAIFCARYSQDWRDNKKEVLVHVFKARDVYKNKGMELGTFGVKNFKEIKVKKIDIENFGK